MVKQFKDDDEDDAATSAVLAGLLFEGVDDLFLHLLLVLVV